MIALAWIGKMALITVVWLTARVLQELFPDVDRIVNLMWLAGWLSAGIWIEFKIESK